MPDTLAYSRDRRLGSQHTVSSYLTDLCTILLAESWFLDCVELQFEELWLCSERHFKVPISATTGAKPTQPEGDGAGCHELGVSTERGKASSGNFLHKVTIAGGVSQRS